MRIVARAGGYYGKSFKGFRGVTQGGPVSPTIFNVVVGAVVRHWVEDMVESTGGKGGRGQDVRHQNALFCVYDGMIVPSYRG